MIFCNMKNDLLNKKYDIHIKLHTFPFFANSTRDWKYNTCIIMRTKQNKQIDQSVM